LVCPRKTDFAGTDSGYFLASYLQSRGFCGRTGVQAHNLILSRNIVSYEWNFDYRNGVFTIDATGPIVTMPYLDGPASATVALRVTDNKGASQIATTSLTVRNVVPIVEASRPYNGLMDSPISFAGTATDAGVVDQKKYFKSLNLYPKKEYL